MRFISFCLSFASILFSCATCNNYRLRIKNSNQSPISGSVGVTNSNSIIYNASFTIPAAVEQKALIQTQELSYTHIAAGVVILTFVVEVLVAAVGIEIWFAGVSEQDNFGLSYTLERILGDGSYLPIYDSRTPIFNGGGNLCLQSPCDAEVTNLSNGPWGDNSLSIKYPGGKAVLSGYRGIGTPIVSIQRGLDLYFEISPVLKSMKSQETTYEFRTAFKFRSNSKSISYYHSAYTTFAQVDIPFVAPTGGLASQITPEQISEFAISIASPTYGIIGNN
jgi:hypothetical protein